MADKFKTAGVQAPSITPEMIRNSKTIACECGGVLFEEKIIFKKLSAILSPSGKEETIPMPVMVCTKCGLIPAVFDPQNVIPKELKAILTDSPVADATLRVIKD